MPVGRADHLTGVCAVQLGDLGSAVSEWSQMLSQAIVVPLRRGDLRRSASPRARTVALAGGAARNFTVRLRGSLFLAAGGLADDLMLHSIHHVGGRKAHTVVLPAASYAFAAAGERYRRSLRRFGMDDAETVEVATRAQADEPKVATSLATADLVVSGGGDPGLLLDRFLKKLIPQKILLNYMCVPPAFSFFLKTPKSTTGSLILSVQVRQAHLHLNSGKGLSGTKLISKVMISP